VNAWQVMRQLRYLLREADWSDSPGSPVFGTSVYVTSGVDPSAAATRLRFPACLIAPGSTQVDEDQDDLDESTIVVTLCASVPGDWTGEAALLGAARAGGAGSSGGRGLLELEEVVRDAVGYLDGQDGIRLQIVGASEPEPTPLEGNTFAVARRIELSAWCRVDRSYPPARGLAATTAGATVALAWTTPPTRYDLLRMVLRRAAGSTAPTSPTAGTGVTLGSGLATSVNDTPGAGTWSYALFAGYAETGGATPDRYSSAATLTVSL